MKHEMMRLGDVALKEEVPHVKALEDCQDPRWSRYGRFYNSIRDQRDAAGIACYVQRAVFWAVVRWSGSESKELQPSRSWL